MAYNNQEMFWHFMSIKKCSFYLQNSDLLVHLDHKPLIKLFTGYTDDEKCNTCGIKATTIPRHVKVLQIKGIANTLPDSVSRFKAVGLYS